MSNMDSLGWSELKRSYVDTSPVKTQLSSQQGAYLEPRLPRLISMSDPELLNQKKMQDKKGGEEHPSQTSVTDERANEGLMRSEAVITDSGGLLSGITKEYSGWDVYNNEAKKVDLELVKDWTASLNSLLLFAAIFAAVLTAFIIESKKMLQQDPNDVMVEVMIFYTNSVANGTHSPYVRSDFQPAQWAINVNCLFFASLSVSLVAALASVISLQWVADYDAAITRGGSSPEDRAKRRHFRHAGVVWWKMAEVIAALPMLLYLSVIFFFSGLILWMRAVHPTVGLVVAGGTGIAILFYFISTFLAVAFVSAPFRTPLSRWVYSLLHLPFSVGYLVVRSLNVQSIPTWLESRHKIYSSSHKREDLQVEKGSELGMQALVWLANQLSVSQDSCKRLLLLAGELPKLDLKQVGYREFAEAPWFSIFDLLGWKHLKTGSRDGINADQMQAFEILIQCDQIPYIHELIRPIELHSYTMDTTCEEYWTQYCDTKVARWSRRAISTNPNFLFLLLRDAPRLPEYSQSVTRAVIYFSRWRNSSVKDIGVWRELLDFAVASSPSALEAFVKTFCQFLRSQDRDSNFRNERHFVEILDQIVRYQIDKNVQLPPPTLDLLLRNFEQVVTWRKPKDTASPICRPVCYSSLLWYSSSDVRLLHCHFTLLLSRYLSTYCGEEIVRRAREVLAMLSLRPFHLSEEHSFSKSAAFRYWDGTDDQSTLKEMELTDWITGVDAVPHINEILHHLAVAQAKHPEIGSLWRVSSPSPANIHFVDALKVFDRMVSPSIPAEDHHMLVSLVCQDLELGDPASLAEYFDTYRLEALGELQDPCLVVLAQLALGHDDNRLPLSSPQTSTCGNLLGPESLKASIWPAFASHPTDLCKQALKDPKVLAHLQRVFEYPIVSCPRHQDGAGHLLIHVFEQVESCTFFVNMMEVTTIPFYGRHFDVPLMILAVPDEDQLNSGEVWMWVEEECLDQLMEICRRVKASQFSLLSLLCDLVISMMMTEGLAAEDVELVSICITNALLLPQDPRISSLISPLSRRVGLLRDEMLKIGFRDPEENEVASGSASRAIRSPMTCLATTKIFGGRNNTILSCARTTHGYSPAVGWSSIYLD